MSRFIEVCCTSLHEALEAEAGGARRIELCRDLSIGGITPEPEILRAVLGAVRIPVNVLVRPRGGDFVFSEKEVSQMLSDIVVCRKAGAAGIVIGALRPDGSACSLPAMKPTPTRAVP